MNQELIDWSQDQWQQLPWRVNRSLYGTLVSEIMLQQTTVATVMKHFEPFMQKFPDIEALAMASEEDVLKAWQGLGYYRRARNLKRAAESLFSQFGHHIPLDKSLLMGIDGIGPYTASALICIGADQLELAVDANLERVLARVYGLDEKKGIKLQKEIHRLFKAGKICLQMKTLGARNLNEALMDLGRNICRARAAFCELCPLNKICIACERQKPLDYPQTDSQRTSKWEQLHLLRIIVKRKDKVLAYKKQAGQWLEGQFELPTFNMNMQTLAQYPAFQWEHYELLPHIKTSITKYRILNFILYADLSDLKILGIDARNFDFISVKENHLSTSSLKCLNFDCA